MARNRRRIRTSSNELTTYLQELRRTPGIEVKLAPGSGHFHIKRGRRLIATLGASPANPHLTIVKTRKKIADSERNDHE